MKTDLTPEQILKIRVRCAEFDSGQPIAEFFIENPTQLPDYTADLNAINAAVLRLDTKMRHRWSSELSKTCRTEFFLATASALERAQAFVAIHEK